MNRKFATVFAIACIAAALAAAGSVAFRIVAEDRAGREAAKADFEGLRSVLAYVKGQADLADPGLRARLASRYEASAGLLFIDVYDRSSGDVWRIPADSPYQAKGKASPPSYPAAATLLLSAPLKGDSTGSLAMDALYTSLTQASIFAAFRDALIGLGAFLAIAALVLAIASSRGARSTAATEAPEGEESFSEEAIALAAAGAQYQYETLGADKGTEEDFDIPIIGNTMSTGLVIKEAPEELEREEAGEPKAEAEEVPLPSESPLTEAAERVEEENKPEGLYSPSSGLGWESYMSERLDAELSRSASFEQDLSLLVFAYDGLASEDSEYGRISSTIKELFSFRDLAFERSEGFSIILPNIDSSHALRMAEDFYKRLVFLAGGDYAELELLPIYLGLSSRSGRLIDAQRLVEEAEAALERSRYEKSTHIVAFKPDPDKYRRYLASREA